MKADRVLGNWCLILAAMVFGMTIGGGHVRTVGAGFSIEVWRPITGFIPPMNAADWSYLFALFQKTALYQSHPITLAQYKSLFWPMFLDRCWGQLMALVFLLPFAWFLATGRLRGRAILWMLAIFALGALQALFGWYMVQQGLQPGVLAPTPIWGGPHFASAMLIFAFLVWIGLTFRTPTPVPLENKAGLRRWTSASILLLFITMGFGALVATTSAVTVYNTFPSMDGHWLPPAMFASGPFWQNQALVQFCHRLLATITALTVLATAILGLRTTLPPALRDNFLLLAGLVALQYLLGMTTIVLGSNNLGYVHELTGVLLFATAICARHKLRGATQGAHP
jgi:cytochrome c oxidase assembly protein subunit 15